MLHALRTEAGFLGVPLPASRCSSDENIARLCACCHQAGLGVLPMLFMQGVSIANASRLSGR